MTQEARRAVKKKMALRTVPNPVTAVNASPSYLFRKVGTEQGATILYDEIDTVFGPKAKENEEIRGLLNASHRRGAVAGRCVVRGKEIVTEEIQAAVALTGLGWLPETPLSRSVIIRMRRRHAGETVEPYRRQIHFPEGDLIRGMIERWTHTAVFDGWPDMPPQIQDRDADVWEPLIAVPGTPDGWSFNLDETGSVPESRTMSVEASSISECIHGSLLVREIMQP